MFTPCKHQHEHNTAKLAQCLHLASINTNTIQLNVYTLPASTQTQYSWVGSMFTPCQHQHKHNTAKLAQCLHLVSINTNTIQLSWLNVYTLPASTQTQYSSMFTPCQHQHKHHRAKLAEPLHLVTINTNTVPLNWLSINTNAQHSLSASTQTHYTACQHKHKHTTQLVSINTTNTIQLSRFNVYNL